MCSRDVSFSVLSSITVVEKRCVSVCVDLWVGWTNVKEMRLISGVEKSSENGVDCWIG